MTPAGIVSKHNSLEDSDKLPKPGVLAAEIVADLEAHWNSIA